MSDGRSTTPDARAFETWIFDLDNTLYPARCNLFAQVDRRMGEFIGDLLGLDPVAAKALQKRYFREHGTTLRGLMTVHGVDPYQFIDYVHQIDVTPVPPSPRLDRALGRLAGRKLIFTNGSVRHADAILARLGVGHHFDTVFDIVASDFVPKPEIAPYRKLIAEHRVAPRTAIMFEDIARNLAPAHALGMTTVWVPGLSEWSRNGAGGDHIHHVAPDLEDWLDRVAPP